MENLIEKHHRESGVTWSEMGKQAGVSKNTLFMIRRLPPEGLGNIKLSTALLIKKNLGIDLMLFYELSTQGAAPESIDQHV